MYPITKLWDLYDITSSKRVFQSEWKKEWIPFYRAREIVKLAQNWYVDNDLFISNKMYQEYSEKYWIPKKGDIMITWVWTIGICYVVKENDKFYFKDWNIIWLKDKLWLANSQFIEYAFKTDFVRAQIDNNAGSVVSTYTIQNAKNTKIPLPPLPTQKLIVQKLDSSFEKIDKSIELTKKNLENIEELNKSVLEEVFREWEFEKVELWKIITLNYWKWVNKEDKNENWLFDVYWANWVMYKSNKFLFDWNSIIIWRKWSAWALKRVYWKFWASDVTYYVTINWKNYLDYIYNWLKFLNIPSLAQWVKPWINRNHVYDLKIPLPPLPKQKEITQYLDQVFEKNKALKESYEMKLKDLEEMKQSLLKEAFEGRLVS